MLSFWKPRSMERRHWKLRTKRPAPKSKTNESATWMIIIALLNLPVPPLKLRVFCCSTRQHQVREVHTGHEQNQSDNASENVKWPFKLGTQVRGDASRGR